MEEYKRLTDKKIDIDSLSDKAKSRISDTYLKYAKINNALWELENKIENGTLIELPCKVGDTLWRWLYGNVYDEWTVDKINIYVENGRVDYTLCCTSKCGCGMDYFYKDDKDIDWTFNKPQTEAEAKLKELKGKYERF